MYRVNVTRDSISYRCTTTIIICVTIMSRNRLPIWSIILLLKIYYWSIDGYGIGTRRDVLYSRRRTRVMCAAECGRPAATATVCLQCLHSARVLERSKRVASKPISIDPRKHYCIDGVGVTGMVYLYRIMTDDHNL